MHKHMGTARTGELWQSMSRLHTYPIISLAYTKRAESLPRVTSILMHNRGYQGDSGLPHSELQCLRIPVKRKEESDPRLGRFGGKVSTSQQFAFTGPESIIGKGDIPIVTVQPRLTSIMLNQSLALNSKKALNAATQLERGRDGTRVKISHNEIYLYKPRFIRADWSRSQTPPLESSLCISRYSGSAQLFLANRSR